jgi:predicted nuclease of predicted toxin-antitoxin system
MTRILLDQGLPRSAVEHLTARGLDACHVADIGHSRASDAEILAMALDQRRTIVTLDSDFHRLLATTGASLPSVIRIRREGLRGAEIAALIDQVISRLHRVIDEGAMITVTEHSARVRRLPLGPVGAWANPQPE